MKIIFWNIYNGFQNGPEEGLYKSNLRESMIADILVEQEADAVALLELQGFNPAKLNTLAQKWNHQHHFLLKGEFPMAFTSKFPLRKPSWNTQNMKHGFISIELQSVKILLCHIPPEKYTDRSKELRQLLAQILPMLEQKQPFILLGDFNAMPNEDFIGALRAVGLVDPIGNDTPRTDYVFAHPSIADNVSVQMLQEDQMSKLSDHYPLIIEIDLPKEDKT